VIFQETHNHGLFNESVEAGTHPTGVENGP